MSDGSLRVERGGDGLVVFVPGHEAFEVSWRWLRDHSEDVASLDADNLQRLVDTFTIPVDLTPTDVVVEPADDGSHPGTLRVRWAPDVGGSVPPDSVLGAALLHEAAESLAPSTGHRGLPHSEVRPWAAGGFPDPLPEVSHDDVIATDDGLREWLDSVARLGFGIVRGMPTTKEAAAVLATRVGPPRSSIFGAMWTLSSEMHDHADSAYSQTFLEPHTDSSYAHDAPGLQMFACLERSGTGGESILVDGAALVERLRADDPEHLRILTEVAVPGRYLEPGVHLRAQRPTLRLDAAGRLVQITFNNYDRAPFLLPPAEMAAWYEAYAHLHRLLTDRDHWLLVRLEPGDVLLFDNWRTLHGRMEYTGTRVFEGCYHHREDFESRLRVLRGDGRGTRPS